MRKRTLRPDSEPTPEAALPLPAEPVEYAPIESAAAESADVPVPEVELPPVADPPTAPSLIWPPPEDELNGWEVLHLHSTGHTIVEPMRYTPEGLVPLAPAAPSQPAPPPPQGAPMAPSAAGAGLAPVPYPSSPSPAGASSPSVPMPRPAVRPSGAVPIARPPADPPPAYTPSYVPPPPVSTTPPLAWPAPPADSELPETQVIEPLMLRSLDPPPARPSDPPTEPRVPVAAPQARTPSRPSLVPPPPVREPDPDDTNPALMTRILPVPNFAKGPRPMSAPSASAESRNSMEDTLPTSIPRVQLPSSAFTPAPAPPQPVPPPHSSQPATAGDVLIRPVTTHHPQSGRPSTYSSVPEPVAYAPPPPTPYAPPPVSVPPPAPAAAPVSAAGPSASRYAGMGGSQFWKLAIWLVALAAVVLVGFLLVRTLYPSAAGPAPATIVIDSTPAGADVLVDGELRGKTPFRGELAPGTHKLELRSGSASRATELTLQAGTLSSHTFEFAAAPAAVGDAAIEVRSDPPGARVIIDGVARGVTPRIVTGLAPGRHQVQVSGPFRPVTRSVTVTAGQQALLVITPARSTPDAPAQSSTAAPPRATPPAQPSGRDAAAARQGTGYVTVQSPLVLRVVRNGEFLGTSDDARLPLPAGSQVIGLENESVGFREVRTVEVVPGRTVTVSVGLPQGTLNINARPWAEVFVDGQRVGETPVAQLALPIGAHEIVFRHPEHGERRVTTVVKVGAPGRAFVDFTK